MEIEAEIEERRIARAPAWGLPDEGRYLTGVRLAVLAVLAAVGAAAVWLDTVLR